MWLAKPAYNRRNPLHAGDSRLEARAVEIVSALGSGGVGEVYRARDVALKFLPTAFTSDPERVARFTREAQLLAALNHPHIAQIYGFIDGGSAGPGDERNPAYIPSTPALVIELVDGEMGVIRFGGRVGYAACVVCRSNSAGLICPSVEWRRRWL